MKRIVILLALCLGLGCKNPYADFYHDSTGGADMSKVAEQVQGKPKVFRGQNPEMDYINMTENRYLLLGYSTFNGGGNVKPEDAISQAERLHASVVVVIDPHYTETRSGTVPMVLPNNSTTYSNGSATAYGPGGTVNAYGSGVSTTYGSQVVTMPYRQDRYDYFASYWARSLSPIIFGVQWRDLTQEERTRIGSNKGARINAVIRESPAFRADFLRNDIVRKINDHEVLDARDAQTTFSSFAGRKVNVEFLRDGNPKTLEVELNQRP